MKLHVHMNSVDRIIENVNTRMSIENMPLLVPDKERLRECLEGKVNFEDALNTLINNHMRKQIE